MSVDRGQKAVHAAIRDRVFAPVYYFFGDEEYLKEDSVRQLIEAAADPGTRDFNLDVRRGGELGEEALASLLATPPMMAERRVVVIRDVNLLSKPARAALDAWLERPSTDCLLILVAPAAVKVDAALERRALPVEWERLSDDRVPKWITYYVEHTLGATIEPDAVRLLQDAVGSDLSQLRLELDKLMSYSAPGTPINARAVSDVVGVRPGETPTDLIDAVLRRDGARALALVPIILQQPKSTGVFTVMTLASQMLVMGWARASLDRGLQRGRLKGELFGLLKASSVFAGRPWGEAIDAWIGSIDKWPSGDIDDALQALYDADYALKESRVSSDEQILSTLVLRMCGTTAMRAA